MIDQFKQHLTKRNIIQFLMLGILVVGIPFAVNLVRQQQVLKSRASTENIIFTGPNVKLIGGKEVAVDPNIRVKVIAPGAGSAPATAAPATAAPATAAPATAAPGATPTISSTELTSEDLTVIGTNFGTQLGTVYYNRGGGSPEVVATVVSGGWSANSVTVSRIVNDPPANLIINGQYVRVCTSAGSCSPWTVMSGGGGTSGPSAPAVSPTTVAYGQTVTFSGLSSGAVMMHVRIWPNDSDNIPIVDGGKLNSGNNYSRTLAITAANGFPPETTFALVRFAGQDAAGNDLPGVGVDIRLTVTHPTTFIPWWQDLLDKLNPIKTVYAVRPPQCSDPSDTDFFSCSDLVNQCPNGSTPTGGGCYPNHYVSDCLANGCGSTATAAPATAAPATAAPATAAPATAAPSASVGPTVAPGSGGSLPTTIPSGVTITKYKVTDEAAASNDSDPIWNSITERRYNSAADADNSTDFTFTPKQCTTQPCDTYPRELRTVFVLFTGTGANNAPFKQLISAQIVLAVKPKITSASCQPATSGAGTTIIVKGLHFGDTGGTVTAGGQLTTATATTWTKMQITTTIPTVLTDQKDVVVTTIDNQSSEPLSCLSGTSQVDFRASLSCRTVDKPLKLAEIDIKELNSVGVGSTAFTTGASLFKDSKVAFDDDGRAAIALSKEKELQEGRSYSISVKAAGSLRRTIKFTAAKGTTALDPVVLLLGDVSPERGDNKINSLDRSEMLQEWSAVKDAVKRADFNQDSRVNSLDDSCLKSNFNKEGDLP